ncbi:MAG: aquaporin [Deltaproteobacteria bacterium]|jgi:glycerol uptake facilitator protein|nr:aquaporin [Deltaproteobacteria bacterium]
MITRREFLGELGATFFMLYTGMATILSAMTTGAQTGLWQIAIVWGLAVAIVVYVFGGLSGGHINPAITLSMAVFRGFSWRKVPGYMFAQCLGAFLAAAVAYCHYRGLLINFETAHEIVRGQPGSELTAMAFADYYPNPALKLHHKWVAEVVTMPMAFLSEFLGLAFITLVVFALTDPKNASGPGHAIAPAIIGFTVAIVISIVTPVSQGCLNPARDLPPRIFAYLAGWDSIALPGSSGFFIVYLAAPFLGSLFGALIYQVFSSGGPSEAKPTSGH